MSDWICADSPPEGEKGLWTKAVVGVTNLGNLYRVSYFHGEEGGVWQRPKSFEAGEYLTLWTDFPTQR